MGTLIEALQSVQLASLLRDMSLPSPELVCGVALALLLTDLLAWTAASRKHHS